ncbi:MAG: hypothetical protein EOP53_06395 [Sphingobacteriales bacterium]|nr:MAG: hypothetical protein EOP53_06395 [Sphingobacteriales bacterium]
MKHLPLTHPQSLAISRIREFFDIWSLPAVLKEADIIFTIAASEEYWRPANPYNALHCCRQLHRLGKAAAMLSKEFNQPFTDCIIAKPGEDGPRLDKEHHFKSNGRYATVFTEIPRHLTADEYRYPIKAVNAYCRLRRKKEWKQFYELLAQCALSTSSLQTYEKPGQLFPLRAQVFKLIEACHLIHVRLGDVGVSIRE